MKKALMPPTTMSDQPVLTLSGTVVAALTANPNFPTTTPTLATVQAGITTYTGSLAKAQYGSREDRAQKKADKAALLNLLREICDCVNGVAKGDAVILSTCGFPLSKDPQPVALGNARPQVENGTFGELILSTPAVKGAVVYKHQYTTDPTAALWPEITTTRATCKIENLQRGQTYSLRIVVIGTNDQVTISDVVTRMVA